jgi:hypothetical protein
MQGIAANSARCSDEHSGSISGLDPFLRLDALKPPVNSFARSSGPCDKSGERVCHQAHLFENHSGLSIIIELQ